MSAPLQSWIIETLIATTALMLVVLAIRGFVAARFGTRAAYLLWLAPALRMIMPPLPQSWFTLPGFAAQGQALKDSVVIVTDVSSTQVIATSATSAPIDWLMLIGIIWIVGAALFFARHMVAYYRFSKHVLASARRVSRQSRINLSASSAIASPIALGAFGGIFGRAIIVPEDFETRFDPIEQRLALAHEITHHQRGDLPINLAALVMLALHWFNPVAHIAHRAFRLDQESACDAIVLNGATVSERHAYSSALFKAAIGPVPIAVCAMGATTTLKTRLQHIITRGSQPERVLTGAALAVAVIGGGLAITASTSFASEIDAKSTPNVRRPDANDTQRGLDEARRGREEAMRGAEEARRGAQEAAEAQREAQEAMREAEQELAEAERDAANDAREAEEEAGAAVRDSKEAMAEAQRSARQAQAEARQALAEARRSVAEARRNMIAPPAPPEPSEAVEAPEPPESPEARAVPEAPARPLTRTASRKKCPRDTDLKVIRNTWRGADKTPQVFNMEMCVPSSRAIQARVRNSLKSTRKTIEAEMRLSAEQRARALAQLDKEIAELSSSSLSQ
jgi:bla regulator protein blaR1